MDDLFEVMQQVVQNLANIAAAPNPNPNVGGGNVPAQGQAAHGEAPPAPAPAPAAAAAAPVPEAAPIPAVVPALNADYVRTLDLFQKMRPPQFAGKASPDKAEEWMLMMDKHFAGIRCAEEYKVDLAAHTLEGEAEFWYRALKRRAASENQEITWVYFLNAFREKYFSRTVMRQKAMEFSNLKQGDMTVDEYESTFSALLRFCPEVEANPDLMVDQFCEGLRGEIRKYTVGTTGYGNVVQRAQAAERDVILFAKERETSKMVAKLAQQSQSQGKSSGSRNERKRKFGDQGKAKKGSLGTKERQGMTRAQGNL